jgi:RNA polymerase sigma-70 factor, ECF subfamily
MKQQHRPSTDRERRQAVTAQLRDISKGDATAAERLLSDLYPDLKRIAAGIFSRERRNHTLQPTALVNEAYLRTFGAEPIDWRDRAHFFALMARQIRRILVDHGRATRAEKRGAGAVKVSLDDTHELGVDTNQDYFALDEALAALEKEDPRAARVVELKFFGGLKDSEVAEVLGTSMPTVTRDWRYARSWLLAMLGPGPIATSGS